MTDYASAVVAHELVTVGPVPREISRLCHGADSNSIDITNVKISL